MFLPISNIVEVYRSNFDVLVKGVPVEKNRTASTMTRHDTTHRLLSQSEMRIHLITPTYTHLHKTNQVPISSSSIRGVHGPPAGLVPRWILAPFFLQVDFRHSKERICKEMEGVFCKRKNGAAQDNCTTIQNDK